MAVTLSVTSSITVDESGLLQNSTQTATAGDAEDNDILVASISGSTGTILPDPFESALFGELGAFTPLQVALSGYTGSGSGENLLTITGTYIDLAFTDAQGDPLGDTSNTLAGQNWSGLYTLDGTKIFLFTDSTNNNIVYGRKGNDGGTLTNPNDDTANSSGTIVFAAYLEETAGGAKVWTVLREPLKQPDTSATTNNHDDVVDMTNNLYVSATTDIGFDFAGVPSGQNLFLMFANTGGTVGIVVTGKSPADQSAGAAVNTGDTVNTSKGGGQTTIGTNNQMIDPGEGMTFSFVTHPVSNYTVPNLTHGEAIVENNIDFGGLFETTGATFVFAQMQPPKGATAKLTAYKEVGALEETSNYVNGLADDAVVKIDHVWVYTNDTKSTLLLDVSINDSGWTAVTGGIQFPAENGITATFWNDGTVTVSGVQSKNALEYHTGDGTTSLLHNRLLIENAGSSTATLNSAFDIGGFFLPNEVPVPVEVGSAINFEDDGPTIIGTKTGVVDEDGLSGGNPAVELALGDVAGAAVTATGLLSDIFDPGKDGLKFFSLSNATADINAIAAYDPVSDATFALTSKGAAVKYDVNVATTNTLTGYVDVGANDSVYTDGTDRKVFTLVLSDTTNLNTASYLFTLLDQLDHPPLTGVVGSDNTENDIVLRLGSVLKVTDNDNDFALGSSGSVTGQPASLAITVDDDSPLIVAKSSLVIANGSTPTGTGVFDYAIGADDRVSFSSTNSDLAVTLTSGQVGSTAITIPSDAIIWTSEDANQATFAVKFNYVPDPASPATTTEATGTLVFNKPAGTYTLSLTAPIASYAVLSTANATGFTGYLPGTSTTDTSQPEVTVAQLASNFFVQFSGYAEPGSGTGSNNLQAGTVPLTFSNGELFTQASTWVSVSGTAAGVAGDTLQQGEVLDFDFFVANPTGFTGTTSTATSSAIFIQFDGLDNNEDLVVVLKLVNPDTNARTTKAVIADYADIFHKADAAGVPAAFGFTGTLDNNDGLVIIERQDYSFAGENWVIEGVQVLNSTEGIQGTGINLNGAIGTGGGSAGSTQDFADAKEPGNVLTGTEAGTWDGDVYKIVNIGFVTNVTQDALLTFSVVVEDSDRDAISAQTLNVTIDGDGSLVPTSGVDTFAIPGGDTDGLLNIAMYNITTGFAATDRIDFVTGVAGDSSNYAEALVAAADLSLFVAAADGALTGPVIYYFGRVGSDGYLATDTDADGITTIVKLAGVSDLDFTNIV